MCVCVCARVFWAHILYNFKEIHILELTFFGICMHFSSSFPSFSPFPVIFENTNRTGGDLKRFEGWRMTASAQLSKWKGIRGEIDLDREPMRGARSSWRSWCWGGTPRSDLSSGRQHKCSCSSRSGTLLCPSASALALSSLAVSIYCHGSMGGKKKLFIFIPVISHEQVHSF